MSKISLCAIVRNEIDKIEAFIDENLEWCDEIVIVDTGSTDGTTQKLMNKRIRLLRGSVSDGFSVARNYSIESAKHDWILILDCDEFVDPEHRNAIKRAIASQHYRAYIQPWITVQGSSIITSTKISLFRNDGNIKFNGLVHEQVAESIKISKASLKRLEAPIFHYPRTFDAKKKNDFYRDLLKKEVSIDKYNPRLNYLLALDALSNLSDSSEALKYHLQGVAGGAGHWPVEYIYNALSAARIMRPCNPKTSLELLRMAISVKNEHKHDFSIKLVKEVLYSVEAFYHFLQGEINLSI